MTAIQNLRHALPQGIDGYAEPVRQSAWEQTWGQLGSASEGIRNFLDNATISGKIPYTDIGGKIGIGELLFQQAPELLNDMSHGQSLLKPGGHGPNLDPRILDLIDVATLGATSAGKAVKPLSKLGKGMLKEGLRPSTKMVKQLGAAGTRKGTHTLQKKGAADFIDVPRGSRTLLPKSAMRDQGGYIQGEHAKGINEFLLNKAKKLSSEGLDEDAIYKQTKWRKDPHSNKWQTEIAHTGEDYPVNDSYHAVKRMQEIEDKNMSFTKEYNDLEDSVMFVEKPYDEVVDNSIFAKSYPDAARNTHVEQFDRAGGAYIKDPSKPGGNMILGQYPGDIDERAFVKTHETQHAFSGEAGFPPGGNPQEMFVKIGAYLDDQLDGHMNKLDLMKKGGVEPSADDVEYLRKLQTDRRRFKQGLDMDDVHRMEGEMLAESAYESLVDEDLANLVAGRRNMTQEGMYADPWYKHLRKDPIQLRRHTKTFADPTQIQRFLASGTK